MKTHLTWTIVGGIAGLLLAFYQKEESMMAKAGYAFLGAVVGCFAFSMFNEKEEEQ